MPYIETVNRGYFQKISDFRFIKKIGGGSFGQVSLAVHKPTKKNYAIKIIDLAGDFSDFQIKLIQRQIKIHITLDHPHIIKLWDTLQEDNKIYMIMEHASKGSLFHHHSDLLNNGISPPVSEIFKFISQTTSAINYLHKLDYMHRDIKPENILLDEDFNIKICDFGWVTNQITTPRNTFCGTYEYMAPQMIFQLSYDYKIDIWAIGVLLYELLHGFAPFSGQNLVEVRQKISQGSYQIKRNISSALRNLIIDILQLKPQKRLQISQILEHPWMKSLQNISEFDEQLSKKTKINFRHSQQYQLAQDNIDLNLIQNNLQNLLKSNSRNIKRTEQEIFKQNLPGNQKSPNSKLKRSPLLKSFLNDNKATIKKNQSQKRIKKKCKTQGQQQLTSYEDCMFLKNLTTTHKNKNQSMENLFKTNPYKKNTFLKQTEYNKKILHLQQTRKMKKYYGKLNDKNQYKNGKIDKKLYELSHKFFEEKAKEENFFGKSRNVFRKM